MTVCIPQVVFLNLASLRLRGILSLAATLLRCSAMYKLNQFKIMNVVENMFSEPRKELEERKNTISVLNGHYLPNKLNWSFYFGE